MKSSRKIGEILIGSGALTKEQLDNGLRERHRLVGEVLLDNGTVTKEHIDKALEIQKKEHTRFVRNVTTLGSIFILLSAFFISGLNKPKAIVIKEAKVITEVDEKMLPVKVTNSFPKDTSKVSVWISWANAKINTQILVKWYYVTDDTPIYDYSLNIPKREGIANVILAMPQGKTLPAGLYKVMILLGKKQLTRPLTFKVQ